MTFWEPWADELTLGTPLPPAPSISVDDGLAWQYQAISGDGLRVPLSRALAQRVTGEPSLVNPGLVLQVAIGQSTVATRRVIANLFYRDVILRRQVSLGTTLHTVVTPTAAKLARTGDRAKVLLSIVTRDQDDNLIADFQRLALMPVRDRAGFVEGGEPGHASVELGFSSFLPVIPTWVLDGLPVITLPEIGRTREDPLVEPVHEALALVRLTQNLAAAHRDRRRGQHAQRLVYGGHTVALAQASLSRADPGIATVLGWKACDHVAPVFEDDLLAFRVTLTEAQRHDQGTVATYRVDGFALRDGGEVPVLRWTPVVWTASRSRPTAEQEVSDAQ